MAERDKAITVIRASYVVVPEDGRQTFVKDKCVVVEGDRIRDICERYQGPADRTIEARGRMVCPGFVNTHVHAGAGGYIRGMAEDQKFLEGTSIYHYSIPLMTLAYTEFTAEDYEAFLEWDFLELLKKGSTTVLEENFGHLDTTVDVIDRIGIRAYVGATYPSKVANIGYIKDGKLTYDRPDEREVFDGLKRGVEVFEKYNGKLNDRLRVRLSVTGPDTCPEPVLRATRVEADRLGCGISTHAAHHKTEMEYCMEKFHASPIQHLYNTGILGPDAIVTHVTFTSDEDRRLLADTHMTVALCPVRKAKDAFRTPYYEYLERGINVSLATDSYSQDIMETIKMAGVLGRLQIGQVGRLTAVHVLDSATLAGARGLGRDDLGRIVPGAKADLVIVDLTKPHTFPVFDPIVSLVHYASGADVETVLVDGKIVIRNGRALTTDEDALRKRVKTAAERLWALAAERGIVSWGN